MTPLIPVFSYLCPYVISSRPPLLTNRIRLTWWDVTSESMLWRLWLALSFLSSCCLDCFLWRKPAMAFETAFREAHVKAWEWIFWGCQRPHEWAWKRILPKMSLEMSSASTDTLTAALWRSSLAAPRFLTHRTGWNNKCSLFLVVIFWGNLLHSNR